MNVKIIADKNECVLKDCRTYYEEDSGWYAALLYEYTDCDNIKHRVVFPKVVLPFNQLTMPTLSEPVYDSITGIPHSPIMVTRSESRVCKASGKVIDFENKTVKYKDALWCDITEKPKEMTIEDIEKALGHKVKIVAKEK